MKKIVVVGAGGFARELRWLIEEINAAAPTWEFAGFVLSDLGKLDQHDSRDLVLGDLGWLVENPGGIQAVAIGIGNGPVRRALAAQIENDFPALEWPALIHPSVRYDAASCKIGRGVILCAGTIATVNVDFRPFCLVNLSCTIGHEAVLGEGAVLNPTVNISGGVLIGAAALIGTGAQVLQYLTVGDGASVGAGAVVSKDVPAGMTVVGIPAKALQR